MRAGPVRRLIGDPGTRLYIRCSRLADKVQYPVVIDYLHVVGGGKEETVNEVEFVAIQLKT